MPSVPNNCLPNSCLSVKVGLLACPLIFLHRDLYRGLRWSHDSYVRILYHHIDMELGGAHHIAEIDLIRDRAGDACHAAAPRSGPPPAPGDCCASRTGTALRTEWSAAAGRLGAASPPHFRASK